MFRSTKRMIAPTDAGPESRQTGVDAGHDSFTVGEICAESLLSAAFSKYLLIVSRHDQDAISFRVQA
jgi:hypothetical protein